MFGHEGWGRAGSGSDDCRIIVYLHGADEQCVTRLVQMERPVVQLAAAELAHIFCNRKKNNTQMR